VTLQLGSEKKIDWTPKGWLFAGLTLGGVLGQAGELHERDWNSCRSPTPPITQSAH
jgi:hypothetical protein